MTASTDACDRLAQSREHLRQALLQVNTGANGAAPTGVDNFFSGLFDRLAAAPGGSLLGQLLAAWWRQQPARVALPLALDAANALVQPVAMRHPYRLVLGAAAAGGLLVLVRPWRWVSQRTLVAGVLPQVLSQAMRHLSSKPRVGVAPDRHDEHA